VIDVAQVQSYLAKKRPDLHKHEDALALLSAEDVAFVERYFTDNFRFAVEIIIRYEDTFLLCQRSERALIAPGVWNIPGGKVKPGEQIYDAMIRECFEETNLWLGHAAYLGYNVINKSHKRIVYTYYTTVSAIDTLKIDTNEFSTWRWIRGEDVDQYESLQPHLKKWLIILHKQ